MDQKAENMDQMARFSKSLHIPSIKGYCWFLTGTVYLKTQYYLSGTDSLSQHIQKNCCFYLLSVCGNTNPNF